MKVATALYHNTLFQEAARRPVFQLTAVLMTREMLTDMLERIGRLRLEPRQPALGGLIWVTGLRGRPGQMSYPQERLGLGAGDSGFLRWAVRW